MTEVFIDNKPEEMSLTGWAGQQVLIEYVSYNADGSVDRVKLGEGKVDDEPECFYAANICGNVCNRLHIYRLSGSSKSFRQVVLPVQERITAESYSRMEITSAALLPEQRQ